MSDGSLAIKAGILALRADLARCEKNGIAPFAYQRCRVLVQPGTVAIVGRGLRVLEAFDLAVGDQQDDHPTLVSKRI